MKIVRYTVAGLALAALFFGCSKTVEGIADARAIEFSVSRDWSGGGGFPTRAGSAAVFGPGDGVGVFACYTPPAGAGTASFVSNFMRNQLVSFDGSVWSYSPVKYWPANGTVEFRGYFPYDAKYDDADNGLQTIVHECRTGLEPLYAAHAAVKAENGALSGDGVGDNGSLRLGFAPLINKINFTANADDGLFDEVESDEYKDCRFLIKEFRVWGFYRRARYTVDTEVWSPDGVAKYTRAAPLDMTQYLDSRNTEEAIPGYVYDPDAGYCTDRAVVISEGAEAVNIFGRSAYFIPMDGVIPGNDPGFEVVYVVLTNKHGENVYKESGIVTRTGSLREIFAGNKGLIRKIIHVNLEFSVDGVTVTRDLEDYKYKPMF